VSLTAIEQRVLSYLDQRGPTHRTNVVCDLASPESRIGQLGGSHNGSNGATPLIMGKWCKRLVDQGYVRCIHDHDGYYRHHAITADGKQRLRTILQEQSHD
jgi:hypothetical protein